MVFDDPLAAGRDVGRVALDLLLGRYPAAVYGRELPEGELPPIFGFHSARAESFESLLRFLAENGYATLNCDEYLSWMSGGPRPANRRSVLLTFDDGMGQVYSVAWPLLRKYGMQAVVFLIPALVRDGDGLGPTLEDVESGQVALEDVEGRDRSEAPLATWPEIRRMHESGTIDFQCHTLRHNLVFTGTRPLGYVHPRLVRSLHPNRLSMWGRQEYRVSPPLGAPIFATAPRMSDVRQVREDPGLRQACVEHVTANGGAAFFDRPDWKARLDAVVREHRKRHGVNVAGESEAERVEEIRADLAEAKAILESRLPGKRVLHLAYPWGIGSRTAMEISSRLGYASNHWGRVEGRLVNRVGDDPLRTARIGEDFLPLLPGRGRSTLRRVVQKKLVKNLRRLAR